MGSRSPTVPLFHYSIIPIFHYSNFLSPSTHVPPTAPTAPSPQGRSAIERETRFRSADKAPPSSPVMLSTLSERKRSDACLRLARRQSTRRAIASPFHP